LILILRRTKRSSCEINYMTWLDVINNDVIRLLLYSRDECFWARFKKTMDKVINVQGKLGPMSKMFDPDFGTAYGQLLPSDDLLDHMRRTYNLDIASQFIVPPPFGGDLWGLIELTEKRLAIFSADISGHGSKIAPITRWLHGLIHEQVKIDTDPVVMLTTLNEILVETLPRGKFVTFFYGVFDLSDSELYFATSATTPPILCLSIHSTATLLPADGVPLGFSLDSEYEPRQVSFPSGGCLVLYSDALIETPHPPHAIFDPESLANFIADHSRLPNAQAKVDAIMQKLDLNKNELSDDLTLVVIRRP